MEAFSFVSWEAFRRWESTRLEDRPEAYKKFKENLTARMFEALENTLPGIRDATVFAELGTPLTNRYYVASTAGNLYGTEKTRSHVGPFSWPIKTPINGLMMCGASTLGHGVAAQRCRDLQLHILHWTVVMAICFNQLVSHCAVIRRIIPNSGRRNSKMVI